MKHPTDIAGRATRARFRAWAWSIGFNPRPHASGRRAIPLAHVGEGPLIERMQRGPLDILGQAVLLGDAVGADDAGDRRGTGEALLLHQQFQRPVAPAAGRHLVHAGLGAALFQHWPDGEALQQRAAGDVLGQLLDGEAGLDPAHVGLAEHEPVERDIARFAQGDPGLRLGHGRVSGWFSATGRPGASLPLHLRRHEAAHPSSASGALRGLAEGPRGRKRRRHVPPSVSG
jgi:hypothetical protein